jgi:hypothetical protein
MLAGALCILALRHGQAARGAVYGQAAAGHFGQASHVTLAIHVGRVLTQRVPAVPCPYPESTYT